MTVDPYDRVLAAMDPAQGVVPHSDPDVLLDEILRAGSEPAPTKTGTVRPGVRVALVVAAVAALVVAIPVFGGEQNAYAGWTAYPAALSTGQRSTVARQCQAWVQGSITKAPTQVVLSERRGDIGLALLSGPGGLLVTCQQILGGSGEPSGGSSETYLTAIPARDEILSDGGSGFSKDDGEPTFRVVSGRVGADVTGVVLHTEERGDVIATVQDGYFTAWWPGPPDTKSRPTGPLPMDFTFTAQLRDGTTRSFTRAQTRSTDPPDTAPPTLTAAQATAEIQAYLDAWGSKGAAIASHAYLTADQQVAHDADAPHLSSGNVIAVTDPQPTPDGLRFHVTLDLSFDGDPVAWSQGANERFVFFTPQAGPAAYAMSFATGP